jgi:hypothetical protein
MTSNLSIIFIFFKDKKLLPYMETLIKDIYTRILLHECQRFGIKEVFATNGSKNLGEARAEG